MAVFKKIFCFTLILFLSVTSAFSQDLTGKELTKTDDLNSLVESGIGLLFGAKDIEGDISKVTVSNDSFNEVTLQVTFDGFSGNWLKGNIIRPDKTRIEEIASNPVPFSSGNEQAEIHFKLKGDSSTGPIESSYIKFIVCKEEDDVTGKVYVYQLSKQWRSSGLTAGGQADDYIREDLEISLTPAPVGSASQLKDDGILILPPPRKVTAVPLNDPVYQTKIERRPMIISTQMIQNLQPVSQQKATIHQGKISPATQQFRRIQTQDANKPLKIAKVDLKPLQLNPEQLENGAEGPGNVAISLWDEISADVNFDFGTDKLSRISTDIFPDKNETSGYYYYYPTSYNLVWTPDESYQLNILYGSGSTDEAGKVVMFAKLSPAVGTREKQMVEELVKDYADNNNLEFKKLLPIPLAEQPAVDLSGQLSSLYGISPGNVSISITNLFNPVDLAWPMTTSNADDLMVGLKEVDLNGSIRLVPQGEMPALNIPVKISLDDKEVLGRIELPNTRWRNQQWKNEMPFPVKLKYMHALFINKDKKGKTQPYIYSWDLGNKEVPVHARVKLNGSNIPGVVDQKAQRIWVEYSVPECTPCKDNVINKLVGGTTTSRKQKIEVVSLVLEKLNAYVMEVTIRSRFADTKGENIVELPPVKVQNDMESCFSEPLFVPEEENMEYEYKIKIITDNDIYQSGWKYSDETTLYVNKALVEQALGTFPGE